MELTECACCKTYEDNLPLVNVHRVRARTERPYNSESIRREMPLWGLLSVHDEPDDWIGEMLPFELGLQRSGVGRVAICSRVLCNIVGCRSRRRRKSHLSAIIAKYFRER